MQSPASVGLRGRLYLTGSIGQRTDPYFLGEVSLVLTTWSQRMPGEVRTVWVAPLSYVTVFEVVPSELFVVSTLLTISLLSCFELNAQRLQ